MSIDLIDDLTPLREEIAELRVQLAEEHSLAVEVSGLAIRRNSIIGEINRALDAAGMDVNEPASMRVDTLAKQRDSARVDRDQWLAEAKRIGDNYRREMQQGEALRSSLATVTAELSSFTAAYHELLDAEGRAAEQEILRLRRELDTAVTIITNGNKVRKMHWEDCAINHKGATCDMGPECGDPDPKAMRLYLGYETQQGAYVLSKGPLVKCFDPGGFNYYLSGNGQIVADFGADMEAGHRLFGHLGLKTWEVVEIEITEVGLRTMAVENKS